MRVRVWIRGAEGPAHDFELVDPPRRGERISIALGGEVEEGIVSDVIWRLIGVEHPTSALALEGEPVGAVAMVHVICRPDSPTLVAVSEEVSSGVANVAVSQPL